MFEAYWGLQRGPFSDDAARRSLEGSPTHAEALARLEFLIESRSRFGLLLGPAGSGKSLVLGELARRAERTGSAVTLVAAAGSDAKGLLAGLAMGLGCPPESTICPWAAVTDRLEELKLEGLGATVLFDNLDRATGEAQAKVEALLGIADSPLTVIATARVESAARLTRGLVDQVSLRIDLTPWNEDETREYLLASLAQAGRKQPAFNDAAVRRLFELSGGAPRKVNQLAELALLAGASHNLVQVDAETIDAVEEELGVVR
ncbi:MAG TPA: AAA family ATPase [Pirellulaceae bacterium]|nr:AAA family ATPase [Pirellulaceae bacterium]